MFDFEDFNLMLTVAPAAAAFLTCLVAYPFYIRWLKSKQIGQYIRQEGPASHAVKARTPTMGGLAFIAAVWICVSVFFALNKQFDFSTICAWFLPLAAGTACALIGIADDYGKVTSKSNKGLSAGRRLLMELTIGAVLAGGLFLLDWQANNPAANKIAVPGMQRPTRRFGQMVVGLQFVESEPSTGPEERRAIKDPIRPITIAADGPLLVLFTFVFVPFVFAGTANALNLHDGMDGLAAGTSLQVFAAFAYMMWLLGDTGGGAAASAATGALLGFLLFNRYPAKVFMGDTGSLFIGGLIAALAISSGLVLWLIPLGIVYILETVSVMAQVAYFKLTKPFTPDKPMSAAALFIHKLTRKLPGEGKRLLRMAPIHHHFEAVAADRGIKEWEVVLWFWLAQAVVCTAVLFAFRP